MNKRQLRRLAVKNPEEFRRLIEGARKREMVARSLLLSTTKRTHATPAELAALNDYLMRRGWRSLYVHDRRMYYLLRAAADQLQKGESLLHHDKRLQDAISRGAIVRMNLQEAEGGSLSLAAAAKKLRVSKTEMVRLFRARLILGFEGEQPGNLRFPAWQFKESKLLPGFQKVLRELNKAKQLDDFGRMLFFLSRSRFLKQKRPIDCLRAGALKEVLQATQGFLCR